MNRLKLPLFVFVSGIIVTTVIFNWLASGKAQANAMPANLSSHLDNFGINHIDVEFKDRNILLNVSLNKQLTCEELIDVLGIQNLAIKNRSYSPICSMVNSNLAVITYRELPLIDA